MIGSFKIRRVTIWIKKELGVTKIGRFFREKAISGAQAKEMIYVY